MHTQACIHGSTAIRIVQDVFIITAGAAGASAELERRKFIVLGTTVSYLRTLREPRDPAPGPLRSLMSLDFFFVPLATKVGASLDQVKASQEERRGAEFRVLIFRSR